MVLLLTNEQAQRQRFFVEHKIRGFLNVHVDELEERILQKTLPKSDQSLVFTKALLIRKIIITCIIQYHLVPWIFK